MRKMLSILVVLATIVLVGCCSEVDNWNDEGRIVRMVKISKSFDLFCDKSTNIVYLRGPGHRSAMTAYLNADGNPARCNEVRR